MRSASATATGRIATASAAIAADLAVGHAQAVLGVVQVALRAPPIELVVLAQGFEPLPRVVAVALCHADVGLVRPHRARGPRPRPPRSGRRGRTPAPAGRRACRRGSRGTSGWCPRA